jgi:hypothetical protein
MTTAPNTRTPGNGAVALLFHAERLSRAVPECERAIYDRTIGKIY